MDELSYVVETYSVDIVCITESWLDSNIADTLCKIGDFTIYRQDRLVGAGGGVVCFVNSGIQSFRVSPYASKDLANDFEIFGSLLDRGFCQDL
mgnify:FL=1